MGKIAVELARALSEREVSGAASAVTPRSLAGGEGWSVDDVLCTCGPRDRPFEERHSRVRIAVVAAGSFQYRTDAGRSLMTPGSLLLGEPGQSFECGHEHGAGDRCVSFGYAPEYFERLAADLGVRPRFRASRLPPLRALSPATARACAGLAGAMGVGWEETALHLAAATLRNAGGAYVAPSKPPPVSSAARVTQIVREIERDPCADLTLSRMACDAGLSPYHFLRTFVALTGVTPRQYILRTRLREAAASLASDASRIADIAFDCGFGDLSNFNHAFLAEFGVSPRVYRRRWID